MSNLGLSVTLPTGEPYLLYEPLGPKHVAFHQSTVPKLIAVGSRGGGKSHLLRFDAHMRALSVPGSFSVLIRDTFRNLELSHINYLPQEMELLGGYYHQTKHVCVYPNGSKLFLSYVGDSDNGLNLLSAQYIAAYWDELSVIPWEFFLKLNASVRIAGHMKDLGIQAVVRAATNPLGESAEYIQHYFVDHDVEPEDDPDYNRADWDFIQINMEDNHTLDIDQYKKQFAGYSGALKKAWLEGTFSYENAMFNFQPTIEGKPWHVIPDIDLKKILPVATVYRAIDAGWYPDPTVCLWIAHLGNRFIVFHEKHWTRTIYSDIVDQIKAEEAKLGIKRVVTTYCDPSMDINTTADIRTLKELYEDAGIPMECSINDRIEFARVIHTALAEVAQQDTPRLQIYQNGRQGCPQLVKTIPQQRFDPKNPMKMANQKNDHWAVTLAYFLLSSGSMEHRTSAPLITRPWMKDKGQSRWTLGNESVRNNPNRYSK